MSGKRAGGLLVILIVGCGNTQTTASSGGTGAAGGNASVPSGGASGTVGGAGAGGGGNAGAYVGGAAGSSGGSGTGGNANAGSGGGTAQVGCVGAFGEPTVVLTTLGMFIDGVTLSPDELELIYFGFPRPDGAGSFSRTTRASKDDAFMPGVSVAELDSACGDPSLRRMGDLTADGLRFYFACHPSDTLNPASLRLATRPSIGAPFVIDDTTYGMVPPHPTLSASELELMADGGDETFLFIRLTTTGAFDSSSTLSVGSGTPDLSPDERFLFGARRDFVTTTEIVVAERVGKFLDFGDPEVIVSSASNINVLWSPEISRDCRSLYYVDRTGDPVTQTISDHVRVVKR